MKDELNSSSQKSFTKIIFETIDKVFEIPQNPYFLVKKYEDVECFQDIYYSKRFPNMALDLYYLPQAGKKYPVIFEIHGGGFSAGDKKYRRCLCRYYAKKTGAIVVNANYGVGESSPCPIPMQQLVDALNWVGENADKYNMDLSKVVVTGDSAGGFYACFLATLQDSPAMQEIFGCKPNVKITAAILNCGLYDMELAMNNNNKLLANGVCKELMGTDLDIALQTTYFKGLKFPQYITENFPETMIIYSVKDIFCKGQGELLTETLEKLQVPTTVICATSAFDNHTYSLTWATSMARKTNHRIIEFLNLHFSGKSPAEEMNEQPKVGDEVYEEENA
jgi:acetyl esterase/lipase